MKLTPEGEARFRKRLQHMPPDIAAHRLEREEERRRRQKEQEAVAIKRPLQGKHNGA